MTIYSPIGKNTGEAIVVFPGGGFHILAIDLEGTEICHCNIHPKAATALEDAQRTIGLIRLNAKKYHINPNKICVIGFSAGGYMVADISTHFQKRAYKPIDAANQLSCRPDFAMAVYPGHMQKRPAKNIQCNLY